MIQFSISTERLLLLIILGLLVFNMLPKRCSSNLQQHLNTTTTRDTVWQTKTDTFKLQTTTYKTVYVDDNNVNNVKQAEPNTVTPKAHTKAKLFKDTLSNADIDIFSYNLLDGNLLNHKIAYNLKVPREITITKTIEKPVYKNGLYLFTETGGNTNTFNNLSLGVQYNRKSKWFASYRFNFNNTTTQPTHNVGVGVKLF